MNNQNILIGAYVCYVILQMYVVKNYILDWQSLLTGDNVEQMKYNLSHKSELTTAFTKEIVSRMKMLEDMDYSDWIYYNNKNAIVTHGGYEYEFFIFERSVNDMANYLSNSHYTLRANVNVDMLGLAYTDILRQANYSFLFNIFQPNPDFLETVYKGPRYEDNTNIYAHYRNDPATNRAVKTNTITGVWKKEMPGEIPFEGVIYVGYNLIDVELQYANKYFEFLGIPFISLLSLGTIIATLILYHASGQNNFWMSLLFLSILNIYLTLFINTKEGITTLEVESNKVKDINDGILSISFLAAVNIYILQTLKEIKNHRNLHNESAFLFTLALILLLFALYKKTDYSKINDIRTHRIKKQLAYNTSIFVNLFVLFNYLVYVSRDGKIISAITSYLKHTL